MNTKDFLSTNYPGKDVHLVVSHHGQQSHVGYYFWESGAKVHTLQKLRDMRLVIGLEPQEIFQMCAETTLVKVTMDGEEIKAV